MSESMSELERARMQVVLNYLDANKEINSAIAAELLGVAVKTASRLLSKAEKLSILNGKVRRRIRCILESNVNISCFGENCRWIKNNF